MADSDAKPIRVSVREVMEIAGDIDGQIYTHDFKLIDQSDMICSLVPELPGGVGAVQRRRARTAAHAWEHTKEVYVVWKPRRIPRRSSPRPTKIFTSVEQGAEVLRERACFPSATFGN